MTTGSLRILAILSVLALTPAVQADDLILSGSPSIEGVEVREATWEEIEYKQPNISRPQKIDADRVAEMRITRPAAFIRGQSALAKQDFGRAVTAFRSVSTMNQEFYALNGKYMLGVAELEWSKQDPSHVAKAVTALTEYVSAAKPKKHFFTPHGVLALADAHMAAGDFSKAESVLGDLASGSMGKKWVDGAKLKRAQVQLAQEKWGPARELFRDLERSSNAEFALAAKVGYASCQVGQKQYPGAAKTLAEVLGEGRRERQTQPPSYGEWRAKAWIVYGQAEEGGAGGDKEKLQWAAYRYLRASVVAVAGTETFAEALYRAKQVFTTMGETDRAEALSQRLNQLCPNSPWTKR